MKRIIHHYSKYVNRNFTFFQKEFSLILYSQRETWYNVRESNEKCCCRQELTGSTVLTYVR